MRLIDADKILYFKGKDIVGEDAYVTQKDVIDEMPTVDAEPVVRCKDCKYGHIYKWEGKYHCELSLHFEIIGKDLKENTLYNSNTEWGADDFCSRGERKDDTN